jgi:hypothetical protein
MKKSQDMLVWLRKMVLGQHNCILAVAGKGHINAVHLQERV